MFKLSFLLYIFLLLGKALFSNPVIFIKKNDRPADLKNFQINAKFQESQIAVLPFKYDTSLPVSIENLVQVINAKFVSALEVITAQQITLLPFSNLDGSTKSPSATDQNSFSTIISGELKFSFERSMTKRCRCYQGDTALAYVGDNSEAIKIKITIDYKITEANSTENSSKGRLVLQASGETIEKALVGILSKLGEAIGEKIYL